MFFSAALNDPSNTTATTQLAGRGSRTATGDTEAGGLLFLRTWSCAGLISLIEGALYPGSIGLARSTPAVRQETPRKGVCLPTPEAWTGSPEWTAMWCVATPTIAACEQL